MKEFFTRRRALFGRLLGCTGRALFGALLAAGQVFGGYAPFTIGAVAAAGPGWEGLGALVGTGLGALALLDFPHALRTMACALLMFTANNAFCEVKAYRKKWFLPAQTAGLILAVEAVYAVRSGSVGAAAYCLCAAALAALYACCCAAALSSPEAARAHPGAALVVLAGVLTALSSAQFQNGLAPGRVAAVLAVLFFAFGRERAEALSSALCIGLSADLAAPEGTGFLHTACYGFCALLTVLLRRGSRVGAAGVFALAAVLFALPLGADTGLALLYECLAGTLLFLLLPGRLLRAAREPEAAKVSADAPADALRPRLREFTAALRELYECYARTRPDEEENPAVIFDRAAEAVCRDCPQRETCWEREYGRTYNALNTAAPSLLRNGEGRAEDFPDGFSERCVRFSSFLAAVNVEVHAFLLRRQYRARLEAARSRSAGQYAQLSELLAQAAERPDAAEAGAVPAALLPYRVGVSMRPKGGSEVSGDSVSTFETAGGELCLLLSDGMGSGEEARRESAFTVHLLERLLRAGVNAGSALRTLNSALELRAEVSDSFTTVDLLTLSLKNGEGELYKYGAAPSYVKRGTRVRRVSCSCLPAGLAEGGTPPETTRVRLEGGSFFVMVTDGVADAGDDAWLQALLAEWTGEDPQMLVSSILADSYAHKGTADDAGVLVLYLPGGAGAASEL